MLDRLFGKPQQQEVDLDTEQEIRNIINAYEQAKMTKMKKNEFIEQYAKEKANDTIF